jgi:hypothetical protein
MFERQQTSPFYLLVHCLWAWCIIFCPSVTLSDSFLQPLGYSTSAKPHFETTYKRSMCTVRTSDIFYLWAIYPLRDSETRARMILWEFFLWPIPGFSERINPKNLGVPRSRANIYCLILSRKCMSAGSTFSSRGRTHESLLILWFQVLSFLCGNVTHAILFIGCRPSGITGLTFSKFNLTAQKSLDSSNDARLL